MFWGSRCVQNEVQIEKTTMKMRGIRKRKDERGENGRLGVALRRLSDAPRELQGLLLELPGRPGVRCEVLWGSLGRLGGCFFLVQGGVLSENRENLDFDEPLNE